MLSGEFVSALWLSVKESVENTSVAHAARVS
jgi:hypothetical protein